MSNCKLVLQTINVFCREALDIILYTVYRINRDYNIVDLLNIDNDKSLEISDGHIQLPPLLLVQKLHVLAEMSPLS